MSQGIIFAILGALSFGLWTIFHQQASSHINSLFGAILVSFTAVVVGIFIFFPKIKTVTLYSDPKGIILLILAGVCALGIDYFALKAYSSGLEVSVGGPIIIAGSIMIAAIIGFIFLNESVSVLKLAGILLIIIGSGILAFTTK